MNGEYPTDDDLERITKWDYRDFRGLFDFVKSIWWSADWGWSEGDGKNVLDKPVREFNVSTGGWSGNEQIIGALQENFMFWSLCWQSSRRGGHYVFQLSPELTQGRKAAEDAT